MRIFKGISFEKGSIAPFRVIFILLGGLAIVVGICVLIWLPDSPVTARLLTKDERIAALERVRDDQGGTENHTFKKDQVYEALLDVRTWIVVLTTMLSEWTWTLNLLACCGKESDRLVLSLASIPNGALSNCKCFVHIISTAMTHTILTDSNIIIKSFGYT